MFPNVKIIHSYVSYLSHKRSVELVLEPVAWKIFDLPRRYFFYLIKKKKKKKRTHTQKTEFFLEALVDAVIMMIAIQILLRCRDIEIVGK